MAYFTDASSLDLERKRCSDWVQHHGVFSTSYVPPGCAFLDWQNSAPVSYFAGLLRNDSRL